MFLVSGRGGHLDLADLELPVEVGKLATGVLQEKLSLQQQDGAEYVEKQKGSQTANPLPIRVEQGGFVSYHELQFAHQPEGVGEKESDGDEESVGNHDVLPISRS